MRTKKNKKAIFIVWKYGENNLLVTLEENYFLTPMLAAKQKGFDVVVIIKDGANILKKDKNFHQDFKIIIYKNLFIYILNIIKLNFQKSIFYVNSLATRSFLVAILAKRTIFIAHCQPKRKTLFKQCLQDIGMYFFKKIRLNNESEKSFLISRGVSAKKLYVLPLTISSIFRKINNIEKQDIVYFGNVTPIKNLLTILKAFKEVLRTKENLKLYIVGEIKDETFYSTLEYLKVSDKVVVVGFLSQNDYLVKLLNSRLLAINSSFGEGQCLSMYGAAKCGCALCLPRIMSFENNFKNKALFHEPTDYKQLAHNIMLYLDNKELIITHNTECIKFINDYCNFDIIQQKVGELFIF